MYKLEINIGFLGDDKVTIESMDFDKIEIIKDFIEFQEDFNWEVDYVPVVPEDEEEEEEEVPAVGVEAVE